MVFLLGDSFDILKSINNRSIDLTVTSPPYDNMRSYYNNHKFNFEGIAEQLFRVTKKGGVVVWIVGDETIDGNESGTSFKQALYFKEIGFKLHDTMIFAKTDFTMPSLNRYHQGFEYMFILTKRYLKTFNPIVDRRNTEAGRTMYSYAKRQNDILVRYHRPNTIREFGARYNIWKYHNDGRVEGNTHPARFPLELVKDHILSWSNENDLILDPFICSGTSAIAAFDLNRKFIGIEINKEYIEMAKRLLLKHIGNERLASWCTVKP